MKVLTVEQMKKYDKLAESEFGIPSIILMENAGRATAQVVEDYVGDAELVSPRVTVICGPGNNGGDGFVVARYLHNSGLVNVRVIQLVADEKYQGDAETNRKIVERLKIPLVKIIEETPEAVNIFKKEIKKSEIIVDAILGTGLRGKVRGWIAEVISAVRANFSAYIVSVDIPSGIDGDTGNVMGICIKADETVTFGYPKSGLIMDSALDFVGVLHTADISLPHENEEIEPPFIESPEEEDIVPLIPKRSLADHKGRFGHLFVVGGCGDYRGAPLLACEAALHSGVGLVTLASIERVTEPVVSKRPDIITHDLSADGDFISAAAVEEIVKALPKKSVLVFGCGLGQGEQSFELVKGIIENVEVPLVIDADGLNALSKDVSLLKKAKSKEIVLTPHPGEMARLLGKNTEEVQVDRLNTARNFAMQNGVTVVLKGARSIIAAPDGRVAINPTGTPGMAVGGMGDVLAGIVGAFLCQGLDGFNALMVSCYVAGLAGEMLAEEATDIGVTAAELVETLPEAFVSLFQEYED